MAGEVFVDALPYIDQGYEEQGVRDAVIILPFFKLTSLLKLYIYKNVFYSISCCIYHLYIFYAYILILGTGIGRRRNP